MTATREDTASADCIRGLLCVALFLAVVAGIMLALAYGLPHRRYDISIDSASGLDLPPSKDLTLDPRFNLTFRIASESPGRRACMEAGTYVEVSYHCVPLAISAAAPHPICVGAKKSLSTPVVAKGTGVRLPGYMMDSLTADLRSGVEAFEVTFKLSGDSLKDVAWCGARRVGDVAAECGQQPTCPRSQADHEDVPNMF